MASSTNQTKSCSILGRKVRIIARIRNYRDNELALSNGSLTSVISVSKSEVDERVTLSFGDQTKSRRDVCEVDHCYGQNEDTALIFSREIEPQISKVFDGENATCVAFGARGSGKTYTIQGSAENTGLTLLAMDEILKIAEKGRYSVAVSLYEVFQDHVYDLLDPKHPEVQVLEDARGKRMLKGLSRVAVKSMLEFQELCCGESRSSKITQKIALDPPRRSHKGLMINILACEENSSSKLVGKMNFVDLAGYENARRNSIDGSNFVENTRNNKSLNALLNVIHALNANEIHVPYRESKLTRVLQDSLGGRNPVLMLICLNPLFCLDTIHVIKLASRLKDLKPLAVCSTAKKQTNSRLPLSAKKSNFLVKGRKLFGDANQSSNSKQRNDIQDNALVKLDILDSASAVELAPSSQKEDSSNIVVLKSESVDIDSTIVPYSQEEEIQTSGPADSAIMEKKDALATGDCNCMEDTFVASGDDIAKENNNHLIDKDRSPPVSIRIKEISDNLKSLCTPTPASMNRPHDTQNQVAGFVESMEPKTPLVAQNMNANGERDFTNFKSPLGTFGQRSSGMKQFLVEDCLQFLNSASKEDLKGLTGIGEKRATYILQLREDEPFKSLDDLQDIGLSAKQVKIMMKDVVGDLFR